MTPSPATRRRRPIAATLFTLMVVQVILAVGLTAAVTGWSLRNGFSNYLVAREGETLDAFVDLVRARIVAEGGLDAFRNDPGVMRNVLDELAPGLGPGRPPPGAARPGGPPPGMDGRNPPPMRGSAESFGGRVGLFDADNTLVSGFEAKLGVAVLTREIVIDGQRVGFARSAAPTALSGVDAGFLRGQLTALIVATAILLAGALVTSWIIARRWARPLKDIEQATQRVAGGDLTVEIPERGAREFASAIRNINAMTRSLHRLDTARRRWLAEISHELRTPVTVLRGEIEGLIDGVRKPEPGAIASLHEEVMAVSGLLDDLHVISLADLGRVQCDLVPLDAVDLALRTVDRFRDLARAKGLQLTLGVHPESAPFQADPKRLDQVMGNLVSNSLNYTRAPGRIVISVTRHEQHLVIGIEDSDPAPAPSEIGRLFEPFYRADASRSRATGGSGLGLAVCRAIVEAHGGQIVARLSDLGGLCVEISLPADPA